MSDREALAVAMLTIVVANTTMLFIVFDMIKDEIRSEAKTVVEEVRNEINELKKHLRGEK